jgi:glucosamine-6-phosphate deaminase
VNLFIAEDQLIFSCTNSLFAEDNSILNCVNSLIAEDNSILNCVNSLIAEDKSILSCVNSLIAEDKSILNYANSLNIVVVSIGWDRGMKMEFIVVKNDEEMSRLAAKHIIGQIRKYPNLVLGLATGSTPKGIYQKLIDEHQVNGTSYRQVQTVNLDEYVGLTPSDLNSYHHYMNEQLFNHVDIQKGNTYIPNGKADDFVRECSRYERIVKELGVDIQILGIGVNGHIGFNEPGTSFQSQTHIVELTNSTRIANSRLFDYLEEVPAHAITMGIQSILHSKEILLLASGIHKAEAMKQLVSGIQSENFPASALHNHLHVTVIADEDAWSLCKGMDEKGQFSIRIK